MLVLKPKVEKLVSYQKETNHFLNEAKTKIAKFEQEGLDKKQQKALFEEGCLSLFRSFRGLPKTSSY